MIEFDWWDDESSVSHLTPQNIFIMWVISVMLYTWQGDNMRVSVWS